jgi:hypothetical protein
VVDFRYHALSLVAVFLALGIGIVLGVTVGDSLISEADQNLRDSLREDVTEARELAQSEQELGSKRDEVIDETSQLVAEGRLRGIDVAVVAIEDLPTSLADSVEEAVDKSGGSIERTVVLDLPDPVRVERARQQERVGRRIGRVIQRGGRARDQAGQFNGRLAGPVDAVIVYRHPPTEPEDEEGAQELELREAFEAGLLKGLRDNVVGVEAMDTDPSQVGWYEDRGVANVDNADIAAGRLALVLLVEDAALAEITGDRPEGSYGYKDTADRALPDLSD